MKEERNKVHYLTREKEELSKIKSDLAKMVDNLESKLWISSKVNNVGKLKLSSDEASVAQELRRELQSMEHIRSQLKHYEKKMEEVQEQLEVEKANFRIMEDEKLKIERYKASDGM